MTSRLPHLAVLLTGLLALSACSQQAPAPAETAAPAAPAAPAETTPAPAAPTDTAAPAATPAPAAQATPPEGPAPVAGTDFVEIAGGQPYEPTNGKIEVVEVFGYTCP
ncbi:MAG TPA: thiol:disulfide interchange protein DsbA/DsbL, partial [Lysobacter sp.]